MLAGLAQQVSQTNIIINNNNSRPRTISPSLFLCHVTAILEEIDIHRLLATKCALTPQEMQAMLPLVFKSLAIWPALCML